MVAVLHSRVVEKGTLERLLLPSQQGDELPNSEAG